VYINDTKITLNSVIFACSARKIDFKWDYVCFAYSVNVNMYIV